MTAVPSIFFGLLAQRSVVGDEVLHIPRQRRDACVGFAASALGLRAQAVDRALRLHQIQGKRDGLLAGCGDDGAGPRRPAQHLENDHAHDDRGDIAIDGRSPRQSDGERTVDSGDQDEQRRRPRHSEQQPPHRAWTG